MLSKKNKRGEKILEDIRFFNAQVGVETDRLVRTITDGTGIDPDQQVQLNLVIHRIAENLARINSRLQIVETVLESNLKADNPLVARVLDALEFQHAYVVDGAQPAAKAQAAAAEDELDYPAEAVLKADDLTQLDNFHPVEEAAGEDRDWCWTGGNPKIRIPFVVDRKDEKSLTIKACDFIHKGLKDKLTIFVDSQAISHEVRREDPYDLIEAKLRAVPENSPGILEIRLPKTFSPQQLGINNDARVLGMAIHSVEISSLPRD